MPEVTVFSRPGCSPCASVKRWFDAKGVEYIVRDISLDPSALSEVQSLGYAGVPVVVTPDKHWAGVNVENMKELVHA